MRSSAAQTGFTLWELLVALLVAGVVLGLGVPNFMEFQRNNAMTSVANNVVTAALLARSQAVQRQVPVTLCLSDDPAVPNPTCLPDPIGDSATRGFIVWVDENNNPDPVTGLPNLGDPTDGNGVLDAGEDVLMRIAPPGGAIELSANCGYVSYGPNGWRRQIPGLCPGVGLNARIAFLFCDDRGNRQSSGDLSTARAVSIDRPGRAQVLQNRALIDTPLITTDLAPVNPTCPFG